MSHTLTASLKQALLSLGFLIAFTGVVVVLLLAAFEDVQHFSLKEEIKMKKIISTLWLVVSCILLCACQPTPNISPIVGEQDGKDSLIISGQGSDGKKGEKASADSFPQKYNDQIDFPKANMIIRYDADISAEGIEGASIYTVQRLKRSDDENIRLVNMFSQGASLYEYAQANKAYWANVLIKLKQKSANGDYDEQFDVNSVVRKIEEKIKNSPESTGRTAFGWENHDQNELCISGL